MTTAAAKNRTVAERSPIGNLEHIAAYSRIFISMPNVAGITPKFLVQNGRHADGKPERWEGIFRLDEIGLPVFDHGLLYGDGVFEGVLVSNGRLFQWREHIDRLFASANRLGIKIPYTPAELTEHVLQAARECGPQGQGTMYLRLVATRGIGDLGIHPSKCAGATIYCIVSKIQLYPDQLYQQGLRLALARKVRRAGAAILDPQVKSCNYLNNILALLETSGQESEETLMLSAEGFVAEATTDNLFVVVRSRNWENDPTQVKILTPAPDMCLRGITRELVLGYGKGLGFGVEESAFLSPGDLLGKDREVFLTGTAAGIVPVVRIDGHVVGDGMPGSITRKLRHLLDLDLADPEMGLDMHVCSNELVRYFTAPPRRHNQPVSEEFVRSVYQTIDTRNWEGLHHIFCKDMTYERPGYEPMVGYDRIDHFYRNERVIASGIHLLEGVVVGEGRGACWGRFVGAHKNGSSIDERFADAFTFENGKIRTRKSYFFRPGV